MAVERFQWARICLINLILFGSFINSNVYEMKKASLLLLVAILFCSSMTILVSAKDVDHVDPIQRKTSTIESRVSEIGRSAKASTKSYIATTNRKFKSLFVITVAQHNFSTIWTTNGSQVVSPVRDLDTTYSTKPPTFCTSTSNS